MKKEASENGSFENPDLESDHVNFRYVGSNQNVLNYICLKIKNGEKIAIVEKRIWKIYIHKFAVWDVLTNFRYS